MKIINPCTCGGLPFISPYEEKKDTPWSNDMYIVRCQLCGNVGGLEYSEDEAVDVWNIRNEKL